MTIRVSNPEPQFGALMPTHQETGHGPALSITEAIANGNSVNGGVLSINDGTNGGAIGGINGFANGEANDSGIPATNEYGYCSRDKDVNGKGDALEELAESSASKRKSKQASYGPIAIISCGIDGRFRVPLD
jgi:hypothetical protein